MEKKIIVNNLKEFRKLLQMMRPHSPALASALQELVGNKVSADGRPSRISDLILFVHVADRIGLLQKVQAIRDFDSHPEWFYDLVDAAMHLENREETCLAILVFYRFLKANDILGDTFQGAPDSPYRSINRLSHTKFLATEYIGREYLFRVRLNESINKPMKERFVTFLAKHTLVGQTVLRYFDVMTSSLHDHHSVWVDFVLSFGDWLGGDSDDIVTLEQFDHQRFGHALSYVVEKYRDNPKLRLDAVMFVFGFFRQLCWDHPEIDFFAGSKLFNLGFLSVKGLPVAISDGYVPAIAGASHIYAPQGKVIFHIHHSIMTSANATIKDYRRVDASDIQTELYRQWYLDYVSCYMSASRMRFYAAKEFVKWLEEYKLSTPQTSITLRHLLKDEVDLYVALLGQRDIKSESYNAYVFQIKGLISFAVDNSFLTMEEKATASLRSVYVRPTSTPHALSGQEVTSIENAFQQLSVDSAGMMMTSILFKLQLMNNIRIGSLCVMRISDLRFLPDGGSLYTHIEKNSGRRPVTHHLGKTSTNLIREALDYTAELRELCPDAFGSDYVFIYRSNARQALGGQLQIMTASRYSQNLQQACRVAGVKEYNSGNIRDTYQTSVRQYSREHGLSEFMENSLTGHVSRRSTNSYDDIALEDLLVEAIGLDLGTVKE